MQRAVHPREVITGRFFLLLAFPAGGFQCQFSQQISLLIKALNLIYLLLLADLLFYGLDFTFVLSLHFLNLPLQLSDLLLQHLKLGILGLLVLCKTDIGQTYSSEKAKHTDCFSDLHIHISRLLRFFSYDTSWLSEFSLLF